jgi:hypothetical protein
MDERMVHPARVISWKKTAGKRRMHSVFKGTKTVGKSRMHSVFGWMGLSSHTGRTFKIRRDVARSVEVFLWIASFSEVGAPTSNCKTQSDCDYLGCSSFCPWSGPPPHACEWYGACTCGGTCPEAPCPPGTISIGDRAFACKSNNLGRGGICQRPPCVGGYHCHCSTCPEGENACP